MSRAALMPAAPTQPEALRLYLAPYSLHSPHALSPPSPGDANCHGGFCPEDKCRCSTDVCETSCAKSGKGIAAMCEMSECKDCADCKATAAIVRKRGLGRHQWR